MSVSQIKGFTLFEAMVVVAIVAIASTFVLPSVRDFQVRGRINTAADQLAGLLMNARTIAASRQRPVFVTRTTSTQGDVYSLRMNSSASSSPVLASYLSPSGTATVITRNPAIDEVVFQPSGLLQRTDTNAAIDWVITVCDSSVRNENGRTLRASRMGRLSNTLNPAVSTCNP